MFLDKRISMSLLLAIFLLVTSGSTLINTATADDEDKMTTVILTTNKGVIEIELDAENAPKTTENFLGYVNDGFYDGVIFHRVIAGFMVQGGGFTPDMDQKAVKGPIPNEADNGLKNDRYTIAMARTSEPHSATAQFFINTQDNDFLNFKSADMQGYGYAVFGKVTAGFEVVNDIEVVDTGRVGPHGDVPLEPVVIESASVK